MGTINSAGLCTASAIGTSNATATTSTVSSTVLAVTHAPLANLTLHRVPVVLASDNNGNVPANATDGDLDTHWESAYSDNQWLYVDLGKIYDLTSVSVVWENAYAASYDVQVSNDATFAAWQTLTSVTKTSNATDNLSVTGTGRYLKLRLNTRALQAYGFSRYELQVCGYVTAGLPTISTVSTGGQNYLALTHIRVLAATDLTYTVETSGDLSAWVSGSSSTAAVSTTNNPGGQTQTVVVRDLAPEDTAPRHFVHLKVTSP